MPIVRATDRPEVTDRVRETVQLIGDEEGNKLCASSISTGRSTHFPALHALTSTRL